MKFSKLFLQSFLAVIVLFSFTCPPIYSEELPAGMDKFIHNYIQSAKQNNAEAIKELAHKNYLECIGQESPGNIDLLIGNQIKTFSREDPIIKISYKEFSDEDRKQITLRMKKSNVEWPVKPDGVVVIMYSSYHNISKSNLTVVHTSQGWKWVHYCKELKKEEPINLFKRDPLDLD